MPEPMIRANVGNRRRSKCFIPMIEAKLAPELSSRLRRFAQAEEEACQLLRVQEHNGERKERREVMPDAQDTVRVETRRGPGHASGVKSGGRALQVNNAGKWGM